MLKRDMKTTRSGSCAQVLALGSCRWNFTVCIEDAPDQSSVIEKAAGRALGIIICSKTQLMSDRSDQLVLLCVWSEEDV